MDIVVTLADYQNKCKKLLKEDIVSYFKSGSDNEITLQNNLSSFNRIYLAPRVLIDMSHFTLQTTILGHEVALPFGIAPIAMQKLIHPEGELLSAAQAYSQNVVFTLSLLATKPLADIKQVNPTGIKFLQVYFLKNVNYTKKIIAIAEHYGFQALVITVDTQTFGKRRKDLRNLFKPSVTLEIFKQLGKNIQYTDQEDHNKSFVHSLDNEITWENIKWIKANTKLKIVLKGVMCPDDVELADMHAVDAIWVSNHGGRQLDTTSATIVALPLIRNRIREIGSKMEIYVDGGVRKGSDIFKCLALGADYVFIGRGFIFSLIDGKEGIRKAFQMLAKQLKTTMMLCGANKIKDINSNYIVGQPNSKL